MSQPTPIFTLPPLWKHRLVIIGLSLLGGLVSQLVSQGFISAAVGSAAGGLVGEVLSYELSQK